LILRWTATLSTLAAGVVLAIAAFGWSGSASAPFEPTVDVVVSPTTPGARAAVSINSNVPAGHHTIRSLIALVPAGWTVNDAPNFDVVGSGTITIDIDCNGSPNTFNFSLVDKQAPGDELTTWEAAIPGFMDLLFRVRIWAPGGYEVSVPFPWSFHPGLVACTPETFNFTVNGSSSSGAPVMTNPSSPGPYTFQMTYASQPAAGTHVVTRTDCVVIGSGACPTPTPGATATPGATPTPPPGDADGDGVLDPLDNCPNWPNPAQNSPPWPVGANDPDCDGFSTGVENSAGTNPLAHCGSAAWPPDINSDTFSDITDVSALTANFGAPAPPGPTRQDIAPDPVDGFIDITDISKMTSFFGLTCA
jgi:hypothetical protein